jgi:hypothetical protein
MLGVLLLFHMSGSGYAHQGYRKAQEQALAKPTRRGGTNNSDKGTQWMLLAMYITNADDDERMPCNADLHRAYDKQC